MAQAIGDLIPKIVQRAAKKHEAIQRLQRHWGRLVGKELARHTRPVSLRRGTLYVQTDEPGSGYVLSLEKPRLLMKLKGCATQEIEEIVVRPGEVG